ncbi:MAG: hypothetical protein VKI63_08895 [Cyanobium sp.]|nr:hypothetical protein [Cyanobium sp.]
MITGELFFNENSTKPWLGKGGGLICVFEGAPNLGALRFSF